MSAILYVILMALAIGMPLIYVGVLQWYKDDFEEEKNKKRMLLRSLPELIAMSVSEVALIKIWYEYANGDIQPVMFALLYVVLVIMTILCMTDYWEKIVPNKILLLLLLLGFIVLGYQAVRDMNVVLKLLPSIILGVIFCMIAFGFTYLLSHGSLGSGDVKLAFLLGIFLTGEYVVGTVFYGCLASCIYSIVQLCRKKLSKKDAIPFVPFLYMGLIIIYLVG